MEIGEFLEYTWVIIIVLAVMCVSIGKKKDAERQRHEQPRSASVSPQPAAPRASSPAPAQMHQPLPRATEMRPTIHAHVAQPDCETHDVPGSLGETSMEGHDPCHEEQMNTLERTSFAPAAGQPGLKLDWSGENMVKAFVMQEVLTRPCDRRRQGR